jgi:hypothetical protein
MRIKFTGTAINEIININNANHYNYYNGGAGDDVYVISPKLTKNIEISDATGSNKINLPNSMTITKTTFSVNGVQYTLSSGTTITINSSSADNLKFVFGDLNQDADPTTPAGQTDFLAATVTKTFAEMGTLFGVDTTKLVAGAAPTVSTIVSAATPAVITTSASGLAIGTVTVSNSTPTFTLTSNAITGTPIQEGQSLTFTVTPSSVVNTETTLNLDILGQAVGGITTQAATTAFSPDVQSITFPVGSSAAKLVTVNVVNDNVIEGVRGYAAELLTSSNAVISSVSGTITDPTAQPLSKISITGAGTDNGSSGHVQFQVASGNYKHTITNFTAGDVIAFPSGQSPSVDDSQAANGIVDLTYALNGTKAVIELTGLTNAASLFFVSSFNNAFGAGTITSY